MGTDSSGLPWCEPGTHDHGVPGFSFQLPEVSDLASFSTSPPFQIQTRKWLSLRYSSEAEGGTAERLP